MEKLHVFQCKILLSDETLGQLRDNIAIQVSTGTVLLPEYIEYLGDADDIKIISLREGKSKQVSNLDTNI